MKTRLGKIGYPLYRDAGPHEGGTRAGLTIRRRLPPQGHARYQGPESPRVTHGEPGSEPAGAGATAGPSTERPASGARRPDRSAPAAREHGDGRH